MMGCRGASESVSMAARVVLSVVVILTNIANAQPVDAGKDTSGQSPPKTREAGGTTTPVVEGPELDAVPSEVEQRELGASGQQT